MLPRKTKYSNCSKPLPSTDAIDRLNKALELLFNRLEIQSSHARNYKAQTAVNLYPHIKSVVFVVNLSGIFIFWQSLISYITRLIFETGYIMCALIFLI